MLPHAGEVRLNVLTLDGRRVATIYDDFLPYSGNSSLPLDCSHIPSGAYVIELRLDEHRVSAPLVIIH